MATLLGLAIGAEEIVWQGETGSVATAGKLPRGRKKPLNVVVIMADDLDVGSSTRVMANVASLLGTAGTTFANSFTDYALCCPSRATFLTGQFARTHGVLENTFLGGGGSLWLDHTNTLPVWLQAAGYHTIHIGKCLNEYGTRTSRETIPPGWSEWYGTPDPDAYRYYNYAINENGVLVSYGGREEDYQTGVYARKAADVIVQSRPVQAVERVDRPAAGVEDP